MHLASNTALVATAVMPDGSATAKLDRPPIFSAVVVQVIGAPCLHTGTSRLCSLIMRFNKF